MDLESNSFAGSIFHWYGKNMRLLPWRETKDPYRIWLSEIILQQTRVDQGLPYYLKFIDKYKNVHQLADATEEEVLALWQGLGYYSRARNLHWCAKQVVNEYGGQFPGSYKALLKLKGIGPYTAAAIASIAFGEKVPVVDGNVFRVLSRMLGIEKNIHESGTREIFFEAAHSLMADLDPSTFNQALMEFGALLCTPKNPKCNQCPVQPSCYAFSHGLQSRLPISLKKLKVRKRFINYLVFESSKEVLMKKRVGKDIWKGLFDFPSIEQDSIMEEDEIGEWVLGKIAEEAFTLTSSDIYRHQLTHQLIQARFFTIVLNDLTFVDWRENVDLQRISKTKLGSTPKPKLIDRFLSEHNLYLS